MEEKTNRVGTKDRYVPPKILATYSKKQLEEMLQRSGLHGSGGACGCGTGLSASPQER